MIARAGEAPIRGASDTSSGKVGMLVHDLLLLAKPRITGMVLVATLFGYGLAAAPPRDWTAQTWAVVAWMLLGTVLVGVGGNALNQYLERNSDRLMPRTRERPLPSGRMTARSVLIGGIACALLGIGLMALAVNVLAALVASTVVVTYVLCYTPLKSRTGLNTLVGAVPGALPPVLGWVAAEGALGQQAWALFLIMFVWQLPHFLAIAWMYREDYASAHIPMLTVEDADGARTGRQLVLYSAVLVPVSLFPAMIGMAGPLYFLGALILSLAFAGTALAMAARLDLPSAKLVLRASLIYLPLLFLLMWFDAR